MLKSSIDDESLTSDHTRSVAEEEHGSIGDILNSTLASEGGRGLYGPFDAGNAEAVHAFCSGDGSRSDDVRSNTPGSLLDRNHTREGVNGSLGRGDVGLIWET